MSLLSFTWVSLLSFSAFLGVSALCALVPLLVGVSAFYADPEFRTLYKPLNYRPIALWPLYWQSNRESTEG
jgi:hypothetical protein